MTSRRISWCAVLAAGTMLLQAQKKAESKHSAPPAHAHAPAPKTNTKREARPAPVQQHPNPPANSQGKTFGNHPPPAPHASNSVARPAVHAATTPRRDEIHRSSGPAREIHTSNGAVVHHPPNGPRRVEMVRPGGQVVVAGAPGHGYVQRPIVVHNTTIIKRTYLNNGVPAARFYQPRMHNGVALFVYRPARYYRPAFYRYAYNPWPRPVVYVWGWRRSPWYPYYSGYFSPYPEYRSPSLWLTDYLIAATLESAYHERMAANRMAINNYAGGQPMTPETKQAIAEEVRRQIEAQRMEQNRMSSPGGTITTIFSDNAQHVFVVNSSYLYNSSVGECMVSEGDVLHMTGAPAVNAASADVVVLSSRGQDCPNGTTVSVPLQDLQEMHNAMMATVDRGLDEMQAKQGHDGIPALPPGSAGTIDSPFAEEAQPDANVAGELDGVIRETDRAEQPPVDPPPPASTKLTFSSTSSAPPTLHPGLSIDQVKAIQGAPEKIVEVGNRKIYLYKDLKVTFTNGLVTDIQ